MKRENRCVIDKKAYAYRSAALKVAKTAYLERNEKLKIYECPVCLDFHLSSQGKSNLEEYYEKWKPTKVVGKSHAKNTRKKNNLRYRRRLVVRTFATIDFSSNLWIKLIEAVARW